MSFPYLVMAAPMAGISMRAYREICRAHGADLACGEMISARALVYGNRKTLELLDLAGEVAPRQVQISGCDPGFVREAAQFAVHLGAELLDLNMGRPVPKVIKNGEGSALMLQPELAGRLIDAARSAGVPVSVKIRAGWDEQHRNAVAFAQMAEAHGAAWITVHGRTRAQMYTGKADWLTIAAVKRALQIPVVGNGDIFQAADAVRLRETTGCDAVMIGRGMLGNPWLFAAVAAALRGEPSPPAPTATEIARQALAHLDRQIERGTYWLLQREGDTPEHRLLAEDLAVRSLRGQLGWYVRGMRGAARMREQLCRLTRRDEVAAALNAMLAESGTDIAGARS